ncbi:hypothetical protein DH2020_035808 [Rehmannia glutinosa]|uniref:Serine aminopeptidase S33 domain-containing protein n=1 Tax=Rehmannia glutinosa TaxID=99300 RepID=A0ABR0V727_REHGL
MEQLINFIIRPPRAEYNPKKDLLDQEFMLKGKWYQRKDLEVVNSRGDVLQCSHYMPIIPPEGITLPCVIYCHGNSGCRTDASEAAVILLPSNITIFTLDFSGSGLSGGDYVTLGCNEKDDLRAVVDYLRTDGNVSLIGLWGRSMGAVTSLMYGAEDPSIAGMVLDSPFSDLVDLMMELVDTYKVRLPKFTVKFAIQYMRRAIQKKAKFDIMDLNTIKVAKSCFVPVLFGHAIDDDFIQPHHSDRIFDAYVGDKNIIKFEGDHNSPRPQFYFDSISIFFNNVLRPPEDERGSTYFDLSHDYFSKVNCFVLWSYIGFDGILVVNSGRAASSTEDAITQLRSKRPMSTIVVSYNSLTCSQNSIGNVESRGSDSCPSSSNMISFELSKSSRHVPGLMDDDDEYVEYPLDTLADFPSNVEEEERMFMEAILMSLKDSKVKHLSVDEPSSNGGSDIPKPEPAPKNDQDNSFSTLSNSLKTESISTSAADEHKLLSHMPLPDPKNDTSTCNHSSPNAVTVNSKDCVTVIKDHTINLAAPHPIAEETSLPTSRNDMPSGDQRSSDFDMADRTTVTVKVEKNPTNNILDGLLRRWDLNFFRNR